MAQPIRNIDRLSDAMRTLDELAGQEKNEIRELLTSQFGNLRKTLYEIEPEVRETFKHASQRFSQFATSSKEEAQQRIKRMGRNIDTKVHQTPWTFIGISAVAAAIAGYALGYNLKAKDK